MEQKKSSERPEGHIDRKDFSDLKKEIKKSENELCLDIIRNGLSQFDEFTPKQQETFCKLCIDKLQLGEWKDFKNKPMKDIRQKIQATINPKKHSENQYVDIKVKPKYELKFDKDSNTSDTPLQHSTDLDTQEILDETEIEKVYNETMQKLKQTFPEIPELQSNPQVNMLHTITFQPEVTGYRKLTLKDHAITIDDPNGPLIFLDNLGGEWKIHGIKIGYQQKESLDLFQQYINQIIENKEIYTITDDILSYNPSQEGGTPIRSLGSKVLKTGVSGSKI